MEINKQNRLKQMRKPNANTAVLSSAAALGVTWLALLLLTMP